MAPSNYTRREVLKFAGLATAATATTATASPLAYARAAVKRGSAPVRITDVRTLLLQPAGQTFVIVKLLTTEPGLHGIGCASGENPRETATVLNQHLKPLLVGKAVDDIEVLWQTNREAPYFRSAAILNHALSGVDGALWDILGKRAGLPLYQLLGGKVRPAASLSAMVRGGEDAASLTDQTHQLLTQGYRHVQVQPASPAGEGIVAALESLRGKFGSGIELLHRITTPLPPEKALELAKALEPLRLFYLENAVAPQNAHSLENLRRQTSTPLALGESCVEPHEWLPSVTHRRIDFLRLRVPAVGGLSMARKIAAACEFSRVRTAWSNPAHVSPVGQAVNLHLNLVTPNFGIQEFVAFPAATRDIFSGAPEVRGGCLHANDRPGLGLDVDERAAVLA